jgi:hypothetical protein
VRSAWEEVRQSVLSQNKSSRIAQADIQRFIGFVEGRLRVNVPPWWERILADGRTYEKVGPFVKIGDEGYYRESGLGLLCPMNTSVRQADSRVVITVGAQSVTITAETIDKLAPGARVKAGSYAVVVLMNGVNCFLVFHRGPASRGRYHVCCVEQSTGLLRWKADAWHSGIMGVQVGPRELRDHRVSLAKNDDNIFVFGVAHHAAYINGFRASDGVSILRFSTW